MKLGEVCKIKNGKNQKSVEDDAGQYPIYGSGGIIGRSREYICNENSVIIGRKGTINRPIFVSTKFWNVDTAFGIETNQATLNSKYFYYFCESFDFEKLSTTVTIPSLTKANISQIEIPLPPLEEQKRIAGTLDKVRELIDLRERELAKFDELVKCRFVEMFGDPVTNPKGWDVGKIKDVVSDVKYGTSRPALEGGKYKYLRMGNITYDGHLDVSELKEIDVPDSEIEKCIVRRGDVLFNRTNSKELVGKTCVFDLDEPMVIAGYIIRVRVNNRAIPEYLSAVLNSTYGKKTLFEMCKAIVGQANINAQELKGISILLPPLSLQEEFARFVAAVDKSKFAVRQSLEKLKICYKSLMQEYFG